MAIHCGNFLKVPFRCKTRFCNTCGVKYAQDRPAMAPSRILNYDGSYVTYYYERHEDGKRVEEKIHVYEFIKLLIKHIPDKNFKVVRYYGIYSKDHKHSKKLIKLLNDIQIKNRELLRKWQYSIELIFGYNPTKCSCGGKFVFFDLKISQQKVLHELPSS